MTLRLTLIVTGLLGIVFPGTVLAQRPVPESHHVEFPPLPAIVRYEALPHHKDLDPDLDDIEPALFLKTEFVDLWVDGLNSRTELDLRRNSAAAIGRAQLLKMLDNPAQYTQPLLDCYASSENRTLRLACINTLVAINDPGAAGLFTQICAEGQADFCRLVEPRLGEWKTPAAEEIWRKRLNDSTALFSLRASAAAGLARLKSADAVKDLLATVADVGNSYRLRLAAADAVAAIDSDASAELAAALRRQNTLSRILSAHLLAQAQSADNRQSLLAMAEDPEVAVALPAWQALLTLEPRLLRSLSEFGVSHTHPDIRQQAIAMMAQFPETGYVAPLIVLINDAHLSVRNDARRTLQSYAESSETLHARVTTSVNDAIANHDWEGKQQDMTLLGELGYSAVLPNCVTELAHPRPEVYVTAAWVLHVMPEPAFARDIEEHIRKVVAASGINSEWNTDSKTRGLQIAYLYQVLGLLDYKPIDDELQRQFSMSSGLAHNARAAAMWSIGLLYEDNPEPEVVKQLLGRLNDRLDMDPEDNYVRTMAAVALAFMKAPDMQEHLDLSLRMDGYSAGNLQAAVWAAKHLGLPEYPPLEIPQMQISNWFLVPLNSPEKSAPASQPGSEPDPEPN